MIVLNFIMVWIWKLLRGKIKFWPLHWHRKKGWKLATQGLSIIIIGGGKYHSLVDDQKEYSKTLVRKIRLEIQSEAYLGIFIYFTGPFIVLGFRLGILILLHTKVPLQKDAITQRNDFHCYKNDNFWTFRHAPDSRGLAQF